jgi:hypothetical protein
MNDLKHLNGKISFFINSDISRIEVYDENSGIRFLSIDLDTTQLARIFSREARVECSMTVNNLENVGKNLEIDKLVFEVPENIEALDKYTTTYRDAIKNYAQKLLDEKNDGWHFSDALASRGSFFEKDGKSFVRGTIKKWVKN